MNDECLKDGGRRREEGGTIASGNLGHRNY